MRYSAVVFILIFCSFTMDSQVTSRLRIQSGNNINFNFQLLDHYRNGREFLNWTRITVFFVDLGDPLREWKLSVSALSPQIDGDAGNSLPLNTIEFSITGDDPFATYNNDLIHAVLGAIDTDLVENGQQTLIPGILTNLNVSYYCGRSIYVPDNSLINQRPDYYYVEILFTLGPE